MNNGAMLNAYPDSLGGTLGQCAQLLDDPALRGAFHTFYILPSLFDTDLDRGFSVISYNLNQLLATEEDLEHLRRMGVDLKLDFVLNHLSVLSPQFQDVIKNGDSSPYRDFFIDWNRFWEGHGTMTEEGFLQPDPALIRDMFFRKPGLPILMVRFPDGRDVPYWNTFYQEVRYRAPDAQELMEVLGLQYGESALLAGEIAQQLQEGIPPAQMALGRHQERIAALLESRRRYLGQMDLNLRSPLVWEFYENTLDQLREYGASIVRLDAFAYAPKTVGKRNFLNEPDTWDMLEQVRRLAQPRGLTLLPEIHDSYASGSYRTLCDKGYMLYDFFLPGLVIDAIENADSTTLLRWARELRERKVQTVNMLGCHDGIPMLDLKGLVPEERIQALIDLIVSRGGLIKNLHGQKNMYYQVNSTYFSALGCDERKLLLARALQLFMPGKPQVWYLDLFAGRNDLQAVRQGGPAGHKEINRTNLTREDVREALAKPVTALQVRMLRMRNQCPAFDLDAHAEFEQPDAHSLRMTWQKDGATALLEADLAKLRFVMRMDTTEGLMELGN